MFTEVAYYSRETSPGQIFELFFNDDVFELIVQQLVMYACQKGNFNFEFIKSIYWYFNSERLLLCLCLDEVDVWEEQDDCHNTLVAVV